MSPWVSAGLGWIRRDRRTESGYINDRGGEIPAKDRRVSSQNNNTQSLNIRLCTEENRAGTNEMRMSSLLVVTLVLGMSGNDALTLLVPALAGFVRWLGLIAAQSVGGRITLLTVVRRGRRRGRRGRGGDGRGAPNIVINTRGGRRRRTPSRSRRRRVLSRTGRRRIPSRSRRRRIRRSRGGRHDRR